MSAYVLPRSSFVEIARFINAHTSGRNDRGLHVYHPEVATLKGPNNYYLSAIEATNILLVENLESVAYRYSCELEDVKVITSRDIGAGRSPRAVDMFGPLRSLQYQSCDRDTYEQSVAKAVLISVLWLAGETAAKDAGAREWA